MLGSAFGHPLWRRVPVRARIPGLTLRVTFRSFGLVTENLRNLVLARSDKATGFVACGTHRSGSPSRLTSRLTTIMCFASPRKRARHSHNSVEMTPFWENVLGTVFGKAARNEGSSLVAVARRSRPGFLFENPDTFSLAVRLRDIPDPLDRGSRADGSALCVHRTDHVLSLTDRAPRVDLSHGL
jgi:hypothetical protein